MIDKTLKVNSITLTQEVTLSGDDAEAFVLSGQLPRPTADDLQIEAQADEDNPITH